MKKSIVFRLTAAALGLGLASGASALGPRDVVVGTGFGVDQEHGRAWVEVQYVNPLFDDVGTRLRKVAIDGLRFDAQRNAVVQVNGNSEVVCATPRQRGVGPFRNTWMAPTGDCIINVSRETGRVDNGFVVREVPQMSVVLEVVAATEQLASGPDVRPRHPVN